MATPETTTEGSVSIGTNHDACTNNLTCYLLAIKTSLLYQPWLSVEMPICICMHYQYHHDSDMMSFDCLIGTLLSTTAQSILFVSSPQPKSVSSFLACGFQDFVTGSIRSAHQTSPKRNCARITSALDLFTRWMPLNKSFVSVNNLGYQPTVAYRLNFALQVQRLQTCRKPVGKDCQERLRRGVTTRAQNTSRIDVTHV